MVSWNKSTDIFKSSAPFPSSKYWIILRMLRNIKKHDTIENNWTHHPYIIHILSIYYPYIIHILSFHETMLIRSARKPIHVPSCMHSWISVDWLNSTLDVAAHFTWGRLSNAHGKVWWVGIPVTQDNSWVLETCYQDNSATRMPLEVKCSYDWYCSSLWEHVPRS